MKKFIVFMAVVVFTVFGVCDVRAASAQPKAGNDVMPRPPAYKDKAELLAEIKRLEGLSGALGAGGVRGRSWQEDFTLGVAYLHAGEAERALVLLEKTVGSRPSFDKAYESLGMARYKAGDLEGAVKAWERALKADPEAAHVRRMMVVANDTLVINRRIAEALRAGGKDGKRGWKSHLELGKLYLKVKKADVSLVHIKKAISIKGGDDAILLEYLGRANAGLGKYKSAAEAFKKAIKLSPDQLRLYGMLADMEYLIKKSEAHSKAKINEEKQKPKKK